MRTVRRIYFYLMAFISFEVVLWGVIVLLRLLASRPAGAATALSGGLAAVLVGVPVFLLHWWVVQRDAAREEEERASWIRAIFLYGVRLALLIPMVQSLLGLVNRFFVQVVMGLSGPAPAGAVYIGGNQTWADNLIALVVLAVFWAYFDRVLRASWQAAGDRNALAEVRVLYRYAWMLYTLALVLIGAVQTLRFIFDVLLGAALATRYRLAAGLALLLVGAPVWTFAWRGARQTDRDTASPVPVGVVFLLSLGGLLAALLFAAVLLGTVVQALLGDRGPLLTQSGSYLSVLIPAAVVWGYFSGHLRRWMDLLAGPVQVRVVRLYRHLLSLAGTAATFFGLVRLLDVIVSLMLTERGLAAPLRGDLGNALGVLVVFAPLWARNWSALQREARAPTGGEAVQDIQRKIYLYLLIFLSLTGWMAAIGRVLFLGINALLGNPAVGLRLQLWQMVPWLVSLTVWLVYHWSILRRDGVLAGRAQQARHALFPVLVLHAGDGVWAGDVAAAIQRLSPRMPVMVRSVEQGTAGDELREARALLLPAGLALDLPPAWRLWLSDFSGRQVIVPDPEEDEPVWVGLPRRSGAEQAQEAARAVVRLAEGEPVEPAPPRTPLIVLGYIALGLIAVQVILFGLLLVSALLTALGD
ncbi:MAG TPA: DUF5671 domain-containing protein [Anaerolineaceae bacterium]|nr:DUF5671 domain-containing protein [Anaerolineaceae bacterium]